MYSKLSFDSPIIKKLRESIYDGEIKAQDVHKDSRYKYNKEVMLFLLQTYSGRTGDISKWVDSSWLSNKEFLLEAFQIVQIEYSFQNLPKEIQQDKDILDLLLQTDLRNFPSYDISIRDTEAFATKAVKKRLTNLGYVSDRLKNDKEFLLPLLKAYSAFPDPLFSFYEYLPETLKNEDDFIFTAVAKNEKILSLVKTSIRKDKAKMKQILALNGLALKYASKDIQKDKESVSIAVSQNYQSFEFASITLKSDRNFINELEQINPDSLDFADPIFTDEKLRQEENIFFENQPDTEEVILIKWDATTLRFQSKGLLSEVLKFKSALNKAVAKIESSPVPQFKKILEMTMDVITTKDYKKKFGKSAPAKANAFYVVNSDKIFILLDAQSDLNYIGSTIIHELAHRFHYLHIKNGDTNKEIIDLFKIATNRRYCQYTKVPQVGDPLTDLNINELTKRWQWTNKMATNFNDYVLKEKTNWVYRYENNAGDYIEITNSEMPHIIKCPSEYGAKDAVEFFAELLTLITINKVKPSQRMIADKFLEIVLRNIK